MQVYAKWSSKVMVPYTIKYAVQNDDGSLTYIADDTTGKALADTTKTFEAKTGTDLYKDYQTGYFPATTSHCPMKFTVEGPNEYTFIYVPATKLPYTVKYLEEGTGKVLHVDKTAETSSAVITETFEVITGYMPDAYQKRLVVSAEEGANNEIIFWYTKDDKHAYYQITHYTQNLDGTTWSEYSSSQAPGDIGTRYTGQPQYDDHGWTFYSGDDRIS